MFAKIAFRPGVKKILANSSWMASEQIIRMLVGLFVGVWIARQLGPYQFGELSFATAFSSLFGIIATLGLNRIVVRELVKNAEDQNYAEILINSVIGVRLCAALFMFLLCTLIAWLAEQGNYILVGIISAGFLFSSFDCIDLFFQSRVEARVTMVARTVAFASITIIKIILLLFNASLIAFALITLAEFIFSAVALWIVYQIRGFKIQLFRIDWHIAKSLINESWTEIIAGFSVLLFMRIDQVMLKNIIGSEAVGIYSVATRLSEAWYFIPIALVASTFPSIIRQREIDPKKYISNLEFLMTSLVALSYSVILVISFIAEPIISSLYGTAYRESAQVLVIHIWCGLFVSLGISSGSWLIAEKKIKLNLYRALLGALTNIFLNLLIIPKYGVVGAAYSTLLSLMSAYLFFDFFVPSMHSIAKNKIKALLLIPMIIKINLK
jgi:O-antigen/teichoic acid export membrane protein